MLVNHCHVLPEGILDKKNVNKGTLAHLTEIMKKREIDEAVLFAPFTSQIPQGSYQCNQWLYELIKEKKQFFGFIVVNPSDINALNILEEFVDKGFVGVKFHSPMFRLSIDDPCLESFYLKVQKYNLPILFHTGIHGWQLEQYVPMLLDKVAQKYPYLKIIIEHMGGFEFFHQALVVIRNNPNCYAGITGILQKCHYWYIPPNEIIYLLDVVDSERIIYGIDFPYNLNIEQDLEIIHSWKLPLKDENNILGESFKKLLKG